MRFLNLTTIAAVFVFSILSAEDSYKIIDLNPPESVSSYATDINDLGQVVGLYYTKDLPNTAQVFLWDKEKGFQYLGRTENSPYINNLGHVVATRKVSEKFWDLLFNNINQITIWRPETGIELLERPAYSQVEHPTPFGDNKIDEKNIADILPVAFNDHGQILIRNHGSYSKADKVWVWHEGKYQKIEQLRSASHLSNEQVITGVSYLPMGKFERLYLPALHRLQDETTVLIPFTQEKFSGNAITSNSHGDTIGKIYDYATQTKKFYLWNAAEGFKELPEKFTPHWINNDSEILGFFQGPSLTELHLFDGTKLINIEKEANIGYSLKEEFVGITLLKKVKINNHHQIIGTGYLRSGYSKRHAFLIEPNTQSNPSVGK